MVSASTLIAWAVALFVAAAASSSGGSLRASAQGIPDAVTPLEQFPATYYTPFKFTCEGVEHEVTPLFAGPEYCALPASCATAITMGTEAAPLSFSNYAGPDAAPQDFSAVRFHAGQVQAPMAFVIGSGDSTGTQGRPTGKIQYWIETDRFSMLNVADSTGVDFLDPGFSGSTADRQPANNVYVKVEFAGFTTTAVHRANVTAAHDLIAPFWTVIIIVDRGVVTGLEWDNSCSGCRDTCVRAADLSGAACGITREVCAAKTDGVSCDLKVYVGWRGTDVNGNYLLSSQSAISNFRAFAAKIAYDALARTANQIAEGLPDSLPSMPDLPKPDF